MKTGILLCGHGSRTVSGTRAFKSLVAALQARYEADYAVDYGFLEFNHPVYEASVERLYERGVRQLYALPVMLFAGTHLKNDIPYELNTIAAQYDDLTITMGRHIGVSSYVLDLIRKRIEEAEARHGLVDRRDSCLLVVGRGTTDPDANSSAHKIAAMVAEGMGFGFNTVAFSGTAYPLVSQCLPMIDKMGFARTLAVPLFFFTGILLERIYASITDFDATSTHTYCYTDALGVDELMLKAFDERLEEIVRGETNMNCQLCKYRKQIIGVEEALGQVQMGHHLRVKGLLFEEEEKVGTQATWGVKLKKLLGI